MSSPDRSNRLIEALSPLDRDALLAFAQPLRFQEGQILQEADEAVGQVLFLDQGLVSALIVFADGRTVEAALIGPEGAVGAAAALSGRPTRTRFTAQTDGVARRIEAGRLRALCDQRPTLREVVRSYVAGQQGELEQSAACNALHRAEQRFARWLLRSHDRIGDDVMRLTQEALASILGAQRTTVNDAAQALQRAGAIAYSRARLRIVDRAVLERAACECYRAVDRPPTG